MARYGVPSPAPARNDEWKAQVYMQLKLPVQAAVDRSVPLAIYLVATDVFDSGGNIVEILNEPVGGSYGSLPGDPAWSAANVNPRLAVCRLLSGYASARC
jgi:hypothetical protein